MKARWILFSIAAVGALAGAPFVESLGLFTDQQSVGANELTTGTIGLSASPASAALTVTNMFPGDAVVREVTITNDGSGETRYSMTTSTSGSATLAATIDLTVKSGVTTCNASNMVNAAVGTVVYDAKLDSGAFGNAASGQHSGDRVLAAGASEQLCFQGSLASTAGNTLQGLSTTATFTFDAEQTTNNP